MGNKQTTPKLKIFHRSKVNSNSNLIQATGLLICFCYHLKFQAANKKTHTQLEDLDVNCIESIMKFLQPDDLASFAKTCTFYESEAKRFFRTTNDDGKVVIHQKNGKLRTASFFSPQVENYETFFHSLIKNVFILLEPDSSSDEIIRFVEKNCPASINSLVIYPKRDGENVYNGNQFVSSSIAKQLKHLKHLGVHSVPVSNLVNHSKTTIKSLNVSIGNAITNDDYWQYQQFPEMELFSYKYHPFSEDVDAEPINLGNFIQRNSQLKGVFCRGNEAVYESLFSINTRLSYVAVEFPFKEDMRTVWSHFELFCKRKVVESLELILSYCRWNSELSSSTLLKIVQLGAVKGLHFEIGERNIDFFDNEAENSIDRNVRRLCVQTTFINLNQNLTEKIDKHFPNLQQLIIRPSPNLKMELKEFLLCFVTSFKSLKELYVYEIWGNFEECDLIELNAARSTLENASHMTIFMPLQSFHDEMDFRRLDQNLISFRRTESVPRGCISCDGHVFSGFRYNSKNLKYMDQLK